MIYILTQTLSVTGSCTVPAGNTIILCLAGIHMDPKLYEEPYKFDPERFSQERVADSERFSFIPFSGGPRNCIGNAPATLYVFRPSHPPYFFLNK